MSLITHQKKSRSLRILPLAAVSTLAIGLVACKPEVVAREEATPRPVKVQPVAAASAERQFSYSGSVQARLVSPVGFRVGGKVLERRVDVGDRVAAGDVIALLDPTDLTLQADAAEANLAAARTRAAVAADALARAQTLFGAGHIAQAALDRAQLEADDAARGVDAMVAARDQARNQIDYATLRADAAGIVTAVFAEPGQVVASGTPVAQVARDGEKEIRIDVPEQDVALMEVGAPVEVTLFAVPGSRLDGTIREIAGAADPASRTFAVRVSVGEAKDARLGMTATVIARRPVETAGFVVPLTALTERDGRKAVWIADPQTGTVQPKDVSVAAFEKGGVRIAEGLAGGDLVVVAGVQFLEPNLPVRVEPATLASAARPAITW